MSKTTIPFTVAGKEIAIDQGLYNKAMTTIKLYDDEELKNDIIMWLEHERFESDKEIVGKYSPEELARAAEEAMHFRLKVGS